MSCARYFYTEVNMPSVRKATHFDVPPLINENCRVLLLGSMLSPKSAEAGFYYAHPQNRFWRVMFALFDAPFSEDKDTRARLALDNGIALWDVLQSCDIEGAADSTIKNAVYNDIAGLLARYPAVTRVYTTGGAAQKYLMRYNKTANDRVVAAAVALPSTSPLNCKASLDALIKAYSVIKNI